SDRPRSGRAAPDPGAASPRLCPAPGGTPCLRDDVVLLGCSRHGAHALCTGDDALRSSATPHHGVDPWGERWCDLPQLHGMDTVVAGVPRPGTHTERRSSDAGADGCAPL